MKKFVCSILLLAACTSAPPPPAPQFTAVPSSVLDVLCTRIRDEGIATTVDLVRTSRPLVTREALQALADDAGYKRSIDPAAVEAAYAANATPLPIGKSTGCPWNPIDAAAPRSRDTMTLELSAPFVAPFGRGAPGVLARIALGGESATWYWIPLANQNGTWVAGRSTPLAMH